MGRGEGVFIGDVIKFEISNGQAPHFFCTKTIGAAQGLLLSLITPPSIMPSADFELPYKE